MTNKISAAPAMPQYAPPVHRAPLSRAMLGRLVDRIEGIVSSGTPTSKDETRSSTKTASRGSSTSKTEDGNETNAGHVTFANQQNTTTVLPSLPTQMLDVLVAETVHALIAIGGHENPPARHIVGFEGIASVKEKLKTVSEELEDFVDCSGAVDIGAHDRR